MKNKIKALNYVTICLIICYILNIGCGNETKKVVVVISQDLINLKEQLTVLSSLIKSNISDVSELNKIIDAKNKLVELSNIKIVLAHRQDSTMFDSIMKSISELQVSIEMKIFTIKELFPITIIDIEETVLKAGDSSLYFVAHKGDSLMLDLNFEENINYFLYNESLKRKEFEKYNFKKFNKTIVIAHTDIYSLKIAIKKDTYSNIIIKRKPVDINSKFMDTEILTDSVLTTKGDKNGVAVVNFILRNIFNEPYNVTLNSTTKAFFGGEKKVIFPISIPKGTKDWLYRLKVSYSLKDTSNTDKFVNDVGASYSKVKLFGLTVYEAEKNYSSLSRELLNNIFIPPAEEAYCNIYFFPSKKEAENYISLLPYKYELDFSVKNSQSRNGLVNLVDKEQVYIGLENTNFKTAIHIWFEAVALVKEIKYYKIIRKAKI
ncbi:MAG: hypothetical protein A2033_19735 [Bacteroidetes bacterium GWA2_31_9]|nr:MAG: hypothetical protein A2033_19735 [Bacteroidetes bacterium GWA2_31_9]